MLIPNLAKVGVESSNLFARSSRFEEARFRPGLFQFRTGLREFARVGVESSTLFACACAMGCRGTPGAIARRTPAPEADLRGV
ncbi:MAG: hypothetical protein B7Y85_00365 [Brevundimonas sp. 32-68-21]|nr:MAG: hypothetical protein B7Y85_00365 [Brevundimonas sp. 32-68-21]